MYAVEGGHTTVVKELHTAGADVSIKDRVSYNISCVDLGYVGARWYTERYNSIQIESKLTTTYSWITIILIV